MDDMVTKGYAKKSEALAPLQRTWYIPCHGVFNPNKPNKIRVLFNSSAEVDGKLINVNLVYGLALGTNLSEYLSDSEKIMQ